MGATKMRDAREVCIMLAEGLKSYKSIKKLVYGHSGQETNSTDCIMIPYLTAKDDFTHRLSICKARRQNIDGLAIDYVSKRIQELKTDGKKILIVVSDGQPWGDGYSGMQAIKHTRKCVDKARSEGVKVFGVGIQSAFAPEIGDMLYGRGNYVILEDTKSSLKVMTSKLKSFLSSM